MDAIIYKNCPRHGSGEPKRPDQLKRRLENCCVYCGTRKSRGDILGPACNNNECQEKRIAELKLTDNQRCVMDGIFDGLTDNEIATEMKITIDGVKKHVGAIAHKFGVRYNRALLARCYAELQTFLKPKIVTTEAAKPTEPEAPQISSHFRKEPEARQRQGTDRREEKAHGDTPKAPGGGARSHHRSGLDSRPKSR